MAGVDIRDYRGDFEDVVELAYRVWVPEYGGKTWIPLPEAAFLREKFASETGARVWSPMRGQASSAASFPFPGGCASPGPTTQFRCSPALRSSHPTDAWLYR